MIQKISALSSASTVVNLSDLLMALTSSIICKVAFGKRYEDEDVESSRFHSLFNELQSMFVAFFFSDYFPFIGGWIDKLSGLSSRVERVFKDMDEFYNQVINDHLDPNKPKSEHEDIVDVLLRLQKERSFSFDHLRPHQSNINGSFNIIAVGTETSALTVVWAMTELMKNPTIMRKVQDELPTLIQCTTFINENDLPKFTYLKAIVKETFRFHPAVPLLIAREVSQKCSLEGYDIPSHSLVFVNAWAIGRDPKFWENPEVFMPESFIESSVDFKGQNFEFIPFGAGKRICPGMLVGASTVELTLANLLYSFNWELIDGVQKEDIDNDVIPGLTMHKKNPPCLIAKMYPHAT
ncbi:hypothetical protein Cgig2_005821 [Carnegiea gigantea]|uniref:Cytochrome P450 n=1 Tax=Carnegiea gigantea TaxID=171969 RepID=A0A9Q1KNP3_9CARY|nr:hypothetical protein Cgig2_005821 [Carnegiea gigantea]